MNEQLHAFHEFLIVKVNLQVPHFLIIHIFTYIYGILHKETNKHLC